MPLVTLRLAIDPARVRVARQADTGAGTKQEFAAVDWCQILQEQM